MPATATGRLPESHPEPASSGVEGVRAADQLQGREAIERRAYELWLERGQPYGSPEIDWLQAEEEIRSKSAETQAQRSQTLSTAAGASHLDRG